MKSLKINILSLLSIFFFISQIYAQDTPKQFFTSARKGQINVVKDYLNKGVDINSKDKKGQTILMYASESGNIQLVNFLLDQGADMNIINTSGEDALSRAKSKKQYRIVDLLTFEKTKLIDSQSAYEKYIEEFQHGDYVSIAKKEILNINYRNAISENNIEAYRSFLTAFPGNVYSNQINHFIDSLTYYQAIEINSIDAVLDYLKFYPKGFYAVEAKEKSKEIALTFTLISTKEINDKLKFCVLDLEHDPRTLGSKIVYRTSVSEPKTDEVYKILRININNGSKHIDFPLKLNEIKASNNFDCYLELPSPSQFGELVWMSTSFLGFNEIVKANEPFVIVLLVKVSKLNSGYYLNYEGRKVLSF